MRITVFTPTYNRAYILPQLYQSLQSQTFHDFEWLIIDDGSTDQTERLVECWIRETNPFSIRYIKKENEGKCRAINDALDLAKGELFTVVDSDDCLTADALEKIDRWVAGLPSDARFCAVAGRWDYAGQESNSPTLPKNQTDATFLDRYPRKENNFFFIGHDRMWIFFTQIHRKYRYPVFEGERFMTEAVAWNRMAHDGYQVRCFNDIIYLAQHQNDGLTNAGKKLFSDNPKGYALWQKELADFLQYGSMQRLRIYLSFYMQSHENHTCAELAQWIGAPRPIMQLCRIYAMVRHGQR